MAFELERFAGMNTCAGAPASPLLPGRAPFTLTPSEALRAQRQHTYLRLLRAVSLGQGSARGGVSGAKWSRQA